MSRVSSAAVRKAMEVLCSEESLRPAIAKLAAEAGVEPPRLEIEQIQAGNASVELVEKQRPVRYPYIQVSCERVVNAMREKFRRFSGTARIGVEIRCSGEQVAAVEEESRLIADAVTEVLENNRGDWGEGFSYAGGYELTHQAAKAGGTNVVQVARVVFELDVRV